MYYNYIIVYYCSTLKYLNLKNCSNIGKESGDMIAEKCHELIRLKVIYLYIQLSWCCDIHNDTFEKIFKNCTKLERIGLVGCKYIVYNNIFRLKIY